MLAYWHGVACVERFSSLGCAFWAFGLAVCLWMFGLLFALDCGFVMACACCRLLLLLAVLCCSRCFVDCGSILVLCVCFCCYGCYLFGLVGDCCLICYFNSVVLGVYFIYVWFGVVVVSSLVLVVLYGVTRC